MIQRLADIKTDATAAFEKESKLLLVRLDEDLITLALADKMTLAWDAAEILKVEAADRTAEDFIENLKQNSSLVNYKGLPTQVLLATPYAMAVPQALTDSIPLFFKTQFGSQHTSVLTDVVNDDIVFAFAPQTWQQELMATLFPEAQIENTMALLTKQALQKTGTEGTCLYLQVGKSYAELVLVQQGKLTIAKSLLYAANADLLYHLLNVARQFNLSPASLSLQLQGQIIEGDSLCRLLQTYFNPVHFANDIAPIRHKAFWEVPSHYFTGLMTAV